jgi:hypothetical protein
LRLSLTSARSSSNHQVIGTQWIFSDKLDKNGGITRNKTRLVAKGYNQEETYTLVAPLDAIHLLLAYA